MSSVVYHIRAGGSYSVGIIIDQFLSDDDTKVLYERWKDKWGLPLEYPGAQYAITCDMVADAPFDELVSAYGKKLAVRLVDASSNAPTN